MRTNSQEKIFSLSSDSPCSWCAPSMYTSGCEQNPWEARFLTLKTQGAMRDTDTFASGPHIFKDALLLGPHSSLDQQQFTAATMVQTDVHLHVCLPQKIKRISVKFFSSVWPQHLTQILTVCGVGWTESNEWMSETHWEYQNEQNTFPKPKVMRID